MPAPLVDTSDVEIDDSVERFLATQKPGTARVYLACLKRFYKYYPGGIPGLIDRMNRDEEENRGREIYDRVRPGEGILQGFADWHREAGYSNKATLQAMSAIQSIMGYYGREVTYKYIQLPPNRPMDVNRKHRWSLDEVRQFVEAAEYLRDKAFIMVAFQSGLSISDILALNYGDIREEYEDGVLPLAIEGYRIKTEAPIRTFIGRDAVKYLRLYLQSRMPLRDDDPLFTLLGSERRATTTTIQKQLRRYAEKLSFIYEEDLDNGFNPARPHSLRAAFRSRLTGKMDDTMIEFFMGHAIGDQVKTYINMPLDELRELYGNYEHLLAVEKTSKEEREEELTTVDRAAYEELDGKYNALARENVELRDRLSRVIEQMTQVSGRLRRLDQLEDDIALLKRLIASQGKTGR